MEQYYMVIDGQRVGPLPISDLAANGLKPDTLVWRAGMQTWEPARTIPELSQALMSAAEESAFGSYAENIDVTPPPSPGQQYGGAPYNPNQYNPNPYAPTHYNWMTWAIISTVVGLFFSCIGAIFGIIAIVNANKANQMYMAGYDVEGAHANSTAKTMTIIALVLAGIGLLFNIGFLFSGGLSSF